MSWDEEIPTCLFCKHSEKHIQMINYPENDRPYYSWACTSFGCDCILDDLDYVKKWELVRRERKENNNTPTCVLCGHSGEQHRHGSCHPENDYPYHIWSCTKFGCDCTITDESLIM